MPPNKCTIAIVEDDASFRRAVERLLWASGFDAQSFASAEEFLHTTEPESHACLIIDLQLPGISGIDLVERIYASAARPPAIFITAQEIPNFQERVSRIPESVYLRKPFPGVALLEAVNSVLKRSSPDTTAPQPNRAVSGPAINYITPRWKKVPLKLTPRRLLLGSHCETLSSEGFGSQCSLRKLHRSP